MLVLSSGEGEVVPVITEVETTYVSQGPRETEDMSIFKVWK